MRALALLIAACVASSGCATSAYQCVAPNGTRVNYLQVSIFRVADMAAPGCTLPVASVPEAPFLLPEGADAQEPENRENAELQMVREDLARHGAIWASHGPASGGFMGALTELGLFALSVWSGAKAAGAALGL